jgi:hypothetical protein
LRSTSTSGVNGPASVDFLAGLPGRDGSNGDCAPVSGSVAASAALTEGSAALPATSDEVAVGARRENAGSGGAGGADESGVRVPGKIGTGTSGAAASPTPACVAGGGIEDGVREPGSGSRSCGVSTTSVFMKARASRAGVGETWASTATVGCGLGRGFIGTVRGDSSNGANEGTIGAIGTIGAAGAPASTRGDGAPADCIVTVPKGSPTGAAGAGAGAPAAAGGLLLT